MEICSSSTRSMYVTTCPRHEFHIYCETQRTINTTTTSVFVIKQFIRHRKTKLQTAIIRPGLNTLGDNLQQHVVVTCHSDKMLCEVCTGKMFVKIFDYAMEICKKTSCKNQAICCCKLLHIFLPHPHTRSDSWPSVFQP